MRATCRRSGCRREEKSEPKRPYVLSPVTAGPRFLLLPETEAEIVLQEVKDKRAPDVKRSDSDKTFRTNVVRLTYLAKRNGGLRGWKLKSDLLTESPSRVFLLHPGPCLVGNKHGCHLDLYFVVLPGLDQRTFEVFQIILTSVDLWLTFLPRLLPFVGQAQRHPYQL
jgi:hypothetical protein